MRTPAAPRNRAHEIVATHKQPGITKPVQLTIEGLQAFISFAALSGHNARDEPPSRRKLVLEEA
jgi:hypothetical protein